MNIYEIEQDTTFQNNEKGYDLIILHPEDEFEQGRDNSVQLDQIFQINSHFKFEEMIMSVPQTGGVTIKVKTKYVYKVILLLMIYGYELASWEKLEAIKQRSSLAFLETV